MLISCQGASLTLAKVLKSFALEFVEHLPQDGRPADRASDERDRRQQQEEKE